MENYESEIDSKEKDRENIIKSMQDELDR